MDQSLSPAKAAALFIVVVLAWGINWSVTKSLVEAVPPLWTASIRSWGALVALLVILRASGNLKAVSKLLGHTNVSTTAKYAHALDDDVRAMLMATETGQGAVQSNVDQEKRNAS